MYNHSILQRLQTFEKELKDIQAKTCDNGFAVNTTRFICERSILLIKIYCSIGSEAPKEMAIAKLQTVLEIIELYYIEYNKNDRKAPIPFTQVTQPALDALSGFLTRFSQTPVKSSNYCEMPSL